MNIGISLFLSEPIYCILIMYLFNNTQLLWLFILSMNPFSFSSNLFIYVSVFICYEMLALRVLVVVLIVF